MVNISIVTACAVTRTQQGGAIVSMHQYAYVETGKIIHPCAQMEIFHNGVNNKSINVPGGMQYSITLDSYCIHLNITSDLPYMDIRPSTDAEWNTLPHIILTSDSL